MHFDASVPAACGKTHLKAPIQHILGLNSTDRHSCQSKGDGASVAISAVWQRQAAGAEPVSFRLMMQSIWLDGAQRKLDWKTRCIQMTLAANVDGAMIAVHRQETPQGNI